MSFSQLPSTRTHIGVISIASVDNLFRHGWSAKFPQTRREGENKFHPLPWYDDEEILKISGPFFFLEKRLNIAPGVQIFLHQSALFIVFSSILAQRNCRHWMNRPRPFQKIEPEQLFSEL